MVQKLVLTSIQRKEFPEVMKISYNSMGLLGLNFPESNFRNYLKLFYDQLDKKAGDEFREFEKIALFIIFDSMLSSNLCPAIK
jgi:hypothetical protein